MEHPKTLLRKNSYAIMEDEYSCMYISVPENESVVILAKEKCVLLIEQFRQPIGSCVIQLLAEE
ncbi:hypothetical protein F6Y03_00835 [Bacillus megaterium]|nr:hypothetical protein [Priestia megaterium]